MFLFAFDCIHDISNKGVCESFMFFKRVQDQRKG